MGAAIFITGTDTGVGKTFVTCALAALFKDLGYRVGVMKPVETGCLERDGELFADDADRLKQAAGCAEAIDTICPYRLAQPLAPSIAAERAGVTIDVDLLLSTIDGIASTHDITFIEGAGGLMVPLLPSYTFADFARVAKLPVIVVAANRLGAINHLVLTLEHASCLGLVTLGYVLNQMSDEASLAADTNREALSSLTGVVCLGELPFMAGSDIGNIETLNIIEKELDLRAIEGVLRNR